MHVHLPQLSSSHGEPYQIEREILRLDRHSLYLARHVSSGRPVFMEVLSSGAHADPDARAQFLLEAHVACQADPARVVPRQVFETNGRLHGTFDVPRGSTLGGTRLPLEARDAIDVGIDVALGLASIHRQHMIHGALRLDGIVVDRVDGRLGARLIDVGYCVPAGIVRTRDLYSHLPVPPPLDAPEHARGVPLHYGSDVYALGAILFQLLTGVPWSPDLPARLPHHVPDRLAALVVRCLSFKPARRGPSMALVASELCRVQSELDRVEADLDFGEHADWFIEDGAALDEDRLVGLFGYQPDPGADRVSRPMPAWIYAAVAFLMLPAAGYFTYLMVAPPT